MFTVPVKAISKDVCKSKRKLKEFEMEHLIFAQSKPRRKILRLGGSVVLAGLLLIVSVWTTTGSAPRLVSPLGGEAASLPGKGPAQTIKIGVAAALTGAPDLGWRQANSVQLAVDEINAAGGVDIGGTFYTLELVSEDGGCNPSMGETAANNLVAAGVAAVVGHTCSNESIPASAIYYAAGIPMVTPSSTMPAVTEQGYNVTFRVITRDDSPPILLATHFRSQLGFDKAAIVELSGFWGNWAVDLVESRFTSSGGTITSRRTANSTSDFGDILAAIKPEGPQAIFYFDDNPGNAALLSSTAHGLGMEDVAIGWSTFSEDKTKLADYANQAGVAAEGDYASMFYRNPEDMPGYADLLAAYQAAGFPNYGDQPGMWGAFAYDAAQIVIAAIDAADSTDPAMIREAIATTINYPGVVGAYKAFNGKGDVIPQWKWLVHYQGGEWFTAEPNVITIGVAQAMSGDTAFLGWPQANSAQLAVDQVNASGGVEIGGTKYIVELVPADGGCNAEMGLAAANNLIDAGVVAVIGHSCSSSSIPASQVYYNAGVAMLSASSTRPGVTEQGYNTTFRIITRDDSPAIMLAATFRQRLNIERAAIVDAFPYTDVIDALENTFESLGGTITSRRTASSPDQYDAVLTAIKAENPQAIFIFADFPENAALLSKTAHNLGMQDVAIGWTTFVDSRDWLDTYAAQAGAAAEGDYAAMYYRNPADMPGYAELLAAYQVAGFPNYGGGPEPFGAFAYDAAQILMGAIDAADSTDPADIRDAIAATADYSGVVGTYEGFDSKGDVIPQWQWLERYKNGDWGVLTFHDIYLPVILQK